MDIKVLEIQLAGKIKWIRPEEVFGCGEGGHAGGRRERR